jgi:hypothetical protein
MSQKGEARPETGRMKFKGDWTGVFIRGDSAFEYAQHLQALSEKLARTKLPKDTIGIKALNSLIDLLQSSEEPTSRDVQHMKQFDKCKSKEE